MTTSPGDPVHPIELRSHSGATVVLPRLGRPAVLAFLPLAFTPVCSAELRDLETVASEHPELYVAGIATDSVATLAAWRSAEGVSVDLLSDHWPHGAAAIALGAFRADVGHASRTTFVLDAHGAVVARFDSAPGVARELDAYRSAIAVLGSVGRGRER